MSDSLSDSAASAGSLQELKHKKAISCLGKSGGWNFVTLMFHMRKEQVEYVGGFIDLCEPKELRINIGLCPPMTTQFFL